MKEEKLAQHYYTARLTKKYISSKQQDCSQISRSKTIKVLCFPNKLLGFWWPDIETLPDWKKNCNPWKSWAQWIWSECAKSRTYWQRMVRMGHTPQICVVKPAQFLLLTISTSLRLWDSKTASVIMFYWSAGLVRETERQIQNNRAYSFYYHYVNES